MSLSDDWADSWPSPYCGRLDDHDEHPTRFGPRREYICPGAPTITKAEKNAVDKSVRRANAASYVMASADACTVHPQHVMVNQGRREELAADLYECACGKQALGNTDENEARRNSG